MRIGGERSADAGNVRKAGAFWAGLSILATNLRSKVDEAIKRRLLFFVEFPPE